MQKYYHFAQEAVLEFYKLVDKKKYQGAFDRLTPDFQNRIWGGDVAEFERGYQFTVGISDIWYHPYSPEDSVADTDVEVGFSETKKVVSYPPIDGLKDIDYLKKIDALKISNKEACLGKIDTFAEKIGDGLDDDLIAFVEGAKQFKELLEELGGDQEQIDDFRLAHLIGDSPVNAALFLTKIDYEENKEHFGMYEKKTEQTFKAECVEDKKRGWLIRGIKYV